MSVEYCQRTKDWLAAHGFNNLAEVRSVLLEKSRQYSVPVVDLESFREIVLDNLVHGMEHYTPRDICRSFIEDGVLKFDKETLGAFCKSLCGKVCLPPMAVDINDSMFYWMVYGTEAILVKKTVDNK